MPLSNSGLGNINISLPPNVASTVILEAIEGITAGNVQAGIAELATKQLTKSDNLSDLQDTSVARSNLVAAKSGLNEDITSLGNADQPLLIAGVLNVPYTSKYNAYQEESQSLSSVNEFNKIIYPIKAVDSLLEFFNSRFTAKNEGVYFVTAALQINVFNPPGRLVISIFVNGLEHTRGADVYTNTNGAALAVTTFLDLNVNDHVEIFVYTTTQVEAYAIPAFGKMTNYFKGIKIA